jgi:hypothetical protein
MTTPSVVTGGAVKRVHTAAVRPRRRPIAPSA